MERVLNSSLALDFYNSIMDWKLLNHSDFSDTQVMIQKVVPDQNCIALVSASILLLLLLYWILVPINLTRDFSESFQDDRPRNHPIPPVYPNGWVPIAESRDVSNTRVLSARVFVNQVIVVRQESGKVAVFDAYCPHLGADLSVGGEIVDSNERSACIKCPFHGWLYRCSDGTCVQVPYAKDQRAPAGVKLKQWPSLERNGYICVWYHAEGAEPSWYPPVMTEIVAGQWQYGGRTENIVNCHLQEVPENGADVGHLNEIHAPSMMMGKSFQSWTRTAVMRFIFGLHEWQADWQPDQQETHLARIKLFQNFTLFGLKVISLDIDVTQVGPCLVLLRFSWPSMNITGVLSQAVMPVAANKQRIVHTIFMNQNVIGRLFSRLMLYGEINQIDRDCMMWQNKKFLKNPTLVKEEKSIARFRQWYLQFYSENSPKRFANQLEW